MYVIQISKPRTDKDYGQFTKTYNTVEEVEKEAKRLARFHAQENPEFTIYRLYKIGTVSAEIDVKVKTKKDA